MDLAAYAMERSIVATSCASFLTRRFHIAPYRRALSFVAHFALFIADERLSASVWRGFSFDK
jgi:hypothetical protein